MKWILGLDKVTPNYILREETGEEEIRTKAVRRAFMKSNYEEGARSSDKKLVRECIRQMERQRGEKKLSGWEERRAGLKGRLGINEDRMERVREEEEGKTEGVVKRVRKRIEEVEGASRRKKVEESKYNAHYKEIATKERPEYLKQRMKKKERNLIARIRCGNEVSGRQHWRKKVEGVEYAKRKRRH